MWNALFIRILEMHLYQLKKEKVIKYVEIHTAFFIQGFAGVFLLIYKRKNKHDDVSNWSWLKLVLTQSDPNSSWHLKNA